ncbi:hypothetical protein [Billgrantia endophytica]
MSILIRCVNRLAEPTLGSIRMGDTELTRLSGRIVLISEWIASRVRHAII